MTSNKESTTCCVGLNDRTGQDRTGQDRTSASSRPGVWRGWRATGDQSQDEWAQYGDLWGATDPRPLQQGLAIDHHWGPIEEGM